MRSPYVERELRKTRPAVTTNPPGGQRRPWTRITEIGLCHLTFEITSKVSIHTAPMPPQTPTTILHSHPPLSNLHSDMAPERTHFPNTSLNPPTPLPPIMPSIPARLRVSPIDCSYMGIYPASLIQLLHGRCLYAQQVIITQSRHMLLEDMHRAGLATVLLRLRPQNWKTSTEG